MAQTIVDLPLGPLPPAVLARPPAHFLTPVYQNLDHRKTVAFFHPGYSANREGARTVSHDPLAEMLRLPAYDNGGFHHGTALAACAIISCNKTGFFTIDSPVGERVSETWDYALSAGKLYYYHLDDTAADPQYPVCSSFYHWVFDAQIIPDQWHAAFDIHTATNPVVTPSQMSDGVHRRDRSCRITNCVDVAETSHIVPRSEDAWFARNGMHVYNSTLMTPGVSSIDDVQNGFLMRCDLHHAFDKRVFCLAVKEGRVVSHYLKRTAELAALYHNCQFRVPEADPSVEFVWARFAWSILFYAEGFTRTPGRRNQHTNVPVPNPNETSYNGNGEMNQKQRKRKRKLSEQEQRREGQQTPKRTANGGNMAETTKNQKSLPKDQDSGSPVEFLSLAHKIGGATCQHNGSTASCSACSTLTELSLITQKQLDFEEERDRKIKEHYFPRMTEESSWSASHTWQKAHWYPGIDQMERMKCQWRMANPQVGSTELRSGESG